jgi:hypothetical protein
MDWQEAALTIAGVIGAAVAVVHGVLVQRLMVRPIEALDGAGDKRLSGAVRRLVPLLLHFSTVFWFMGGLSLIAAASWMDQSARLATCAFVGAMYLFAALGNLWATRGRHPGWMLMALALALIILAASKPG